MTRTATASVLTPPEGRANRYLNIGDWIFALIALYGLGASIYLRRLYRARQ